VAVAAGHDRLVAVGRTDILVSTDGLAWQPVGLPGGQGVMHDIVATDEGFVAVGSVSLGSMQSKGAIWASTDGMTWTRLPDDPAFENAEIVRVAADEDRVVAVGYSTSVERGLFAVPTAWTAVRGGAWHLATVVDEHLPERPPFGEGNAGSLEGAIMGPVARTAEGWISAGQAWTIGEGYETSGGDLAIWTSGDGTSWRRVPPHRRFELAISEGSLRGGPSAVIETDEHTFIYGVDRGGSVVWVSPARADGVEPAPRPTPVATPSG
jgi:hypothetical protein